MPPSAASRSRAPAASGAKRSRTASGATADKENNRAFALGSSSSSGGGRAAAAHGDDGEEEEPYYEEEVAAVTKGRSQPAKAARGAAAREPMASSERSSGPDDIPAETRIRMLEKKLELMTSERDAIQGEFDELRELRKTEPETTLNEWKKASETRHRHQQELITTLRTRLEASEKRVRSLQGDGAGSAAGDATGAAASHSEAELRDQLDEMKRELERERDEAKRKERKLEDEVKRLNRELQAEITSSRALIEKSHVSSALSSSQSHVRSASGSSTSAAVTGIRGTENVSLSDEKAIRKLYEDLTGLIVNGAETYDRKAGFRRFKAVFACAGHHDIQLSFEESRSDLPAYDGSTSARQQRDDLVYIPHLDSDRDAELIDLLSRSGNKNSFVLDTIRFDRAAGVKFMGALQKAAVRSGRD